MPQRRRRKRLGSSTTAPNTAHADAPNKVWAIDFQFEHTRECLGGLIERSITGDKLIDELDRLARQRGSPAVIRADNGPEMACAAMADWAGQRVGSSFIPPGEPWRNGYVESFNSKVRDECLNINIFWPLTQARVVIIDWKDEYNHHRRHSALGYQAPAHYAAACTHQRTTLTDRGSIHGVRPTLSTRIARFAVIRRSMSSSARTYTSALPPIRRHSSSLMTMFTSTRPDVGQQCQEARERFVWR